MIVWGWRNFYLDPKVHHVNLDNPEAEEVEEVDLEEVEVDLQEDFLEEILEVDPQEVEEEVLEVEIEEDKDLEEEDLNNDKKKCFSFIFQLIFGLNVHFLSSAYSKCSFN